MLREYLAAAVEITPERPVLIDRFLDNAIEPRPMPCTTVPTPLSRRSWNISNWPGSIRGFRLRPAVGQHLPAVPGGDLRIYREIARELKVVGLLNIQYAIADRKVYVLEANPRASRTVPLVSRSAICPWSAQATMLMLPEEMGGKKLATLNLKPGSLPHFGLKESVFPFNMFPEVDPSSGRRCVPPARGPGTLRLLRDRLL